MAGPLNDISNRLTPSVPIEQTFGAQPIAAGAKISTLFGHMNASPGTGTPYQVYSIVNVGDPAAAKTEVDALAGVNSQISKMTAAFINANVLAGRSNFPAFRVVLIPFAETSFGPNDEATNAVKFLRSDMFVSCYKASDSANRTKLLALASLVSGIDRDLVGQFGSFITWGSVDALATAVAYAINSRLGLVGYLQDTNTALRNVTATTVSGSPILTAVLGAILSPTGDIATGSNIISNMSSVAGIEPGASITATGIPALSTVKTIVGNSLTISANATATTTAVALTIQNSPGTAGIYQGATLTGTGIPAGTVAGVVDKTTIPMVDANGAPVNATASGSSIAIAAQNVISQSEEILAAAHAGAMMSFGFPYIPLQGVKIGGLIQPRKTSDWIVPDPAGASEAALQAGLSPLYPQVGGTVGFIRTLTTYNLLPDNVTRATAYIDWQELVTLNDFKEDIYQVSQQPPFNNNPGGTKASGTKAALFKDEVIRVAQEFEDAEAFQQVALSAKFFVVKPSTTARGRWDFKIPVNVLPGLTVIAGNIQAVTDLTNFTL